MRPAIPVSSLIAGAMLLAGAAGLRGQGPERPRLLPKEGDASAMVDRVVAQVEGEAILLSDVQQWAQMLITREHITTRSPAQVEAIMQRALTMLIEQKVMLAQALEDSIEVQEAELDQVIKQRQDQMVSQYGSEEGVEKALGYSLRDLAKLYRQEIRKDLLAQKMQEKKFQDLSISRREVEEFYRTHHDSLPESPQMYKLRHILRKVPAGEEAYKAAQDAILLIKQRLAGGEDFATLARDFSEDPGSAKMGGDLGWFNRGQMVPEFEETAFRLQPGERSGIVRTQYGYHIIEVQEREVNRVRARHILRAAKPTAADKQKVAQFLLSLKERVRRGESFATLAQQLSEDAEGAPKGGDLGWFSLHDLAIPEFAATIEKLSVGDISDPVETSFGLHLIWLENRRESHTLTLETDYETLEGMALNFKRYDEFNRWLATIKKQFYVEYKEEL